jgi:chemotaxis signal transduction protein
MNEHFAQIDGETTESLKTTLQLVGFVIGEELFGVDILTVQEIIREVDYHRHSRLSRFSRRGDQPPGQHHPRD